MTYLITQTLNGLFSAALLFLIASGLTLVFGVMRIVNIAHGSFYMLGAYVASTVVARSRSLALAAVSSILLVAAVGFAVEVLFLRRFAPEGVPWAHLDTFAWRPNAKAARPKGGEAYGLRAAWALLKGRYAG